MFGYFPVVKLYLPNNDLRSSFSAKPADETLLSIVASQRCRHMLETAPVAAGAFEAPPLGNSLTVERVALTRLVLVRIQVPQPIPFPPGTPLIEPDRDILYVP